MADKVNAPAVDEDQSEKRARTGQGEDPSKVSDFGAERKKAFNRIDRSGSPAVSAAERIAAREEAVAEAAGESDSKQARAKVAGKDVGPVPTQPVPDPTAGGPVYVEPPVRPGFIPAGSSEDEVRAGVTKE